MQSDYFDTNKAQFKCQCVIGMEIGENFCSTKIATEHSLKIYCLMKEKHLQRAWRLPVGDYLKRTNQ